MMVYVSVWLGILNLSQLPGSVIVKPFGSSLRIGAQTFVDVKSMDHFIMLDLIKIRVVRTGS